MIQFFLKIFLFVIILNISHQFNISPVPNHVFKDPELRTSMQKFQSSLFGFSLTLRESRYEINNF